MFGDIAGVPLPATLPLVFAAFGLAFGIRRRAWSAAPGPRGLSDGIETMGLERGGVETAAVDAGDVDAVGLQFDQHVIRLVHEVEVFDRQPSGQFDGVVLGIAEIDDHIHPGALLEHESVGFGAAVEDVVAFASRQVVVARAATDDDRLEAFEHYTGDHIVPVVGGMNFDVGLQVNVGPMGVVDRVGRATKPTGLGIVDRDLVLARAANGRVMPLRNCHRVVAVAGGDIVVSRGVSDLVLAIGALDRRHDIPLFCRQGLGIRVAGLGTG